MRLARSVAYPRPFRPLMGGPVEYAGLTVTVTKWGSSVASWVERQVAEGRRIGLAPEMLGCLAIDMDLANPNEEVRREGLAVMMGVMEAARTLGFPQVSAAPGEELGEEEEVQPRLLALVRSLNELIKRASQQGVDLLIPVPLAGHLGYNPEELEQIVHLVDGDLGLCYDVTADLPPPGLQQAVRHMRLGVADDSVLQSSVGELRQLVGSWYEGPVTVESMFSRV
jgi:hypothetical protein